MGLLELIKKVRSRVLRRLTHLVLKPQHIAVQGLRSRSDTGFYPEVARRAAQDARSFATFKRNTAYREVLEHVDAKQGGQYLQQIQNKWPGLIEDIDRFKVNDAVGAPILATYQQIGRISPSTLRYLKVVSDLRELFGDLSGFEVAEIGGGYGGQFLIADQLWPLASWTIFDLDPVLLLTSRYLECHLVNSVYKPTTLNRFDCRTAQFDLAISNYAFSELPKPLQVKYISKVLAKAKRGYMTMNSGKALGDGQHMTTTELRTYFPSMAIIEEIPLTSSQNYVLAWGQQ
jgi:putative sugar O-methyltransferase